MLQVLSIETAARRLDPALAPMKRSAPQLRRGAVRERLAASTFLPDHPPSYALLRTSLLFGDEDLGQRALALHAGSAHAAPSTPVGSVKYFGPKLLSGAAGSAGLHEIGRVDARSLREAFALFTDDDAAARFAHQTFVASTSFIRVHRVDVDDRGVVFFPLYDLLRDDGLLTSRPLRASGP